MWHEVTIEVSDPEALAALACLVNRAEQQPAPRRRMDYSIRRGADGYELFEQGDRLGSVSDTMALLDWVYARVYRRALEYASLCGWVRLHAGLVALPDRRRVLIAGSTSVGKTTTIVQLLVAGIQVHGDEYVLVRDGQAIAVPRLLRVEPETVDLIPELSLSRLLPELPDGSARMLDPSVVAGGWSIDQGPIDEVVLLHGYAERERLEQIPITEVMPELVAQALPNGEDTATVLRQIARILSSTDSAPPRGWRLIAGSPAATAELVRGLAAR